MPNPFKKSVNLMSSLNIRKGSVTTYTITFNRFSPYKQRQLYRAIDRGLMLYIFVNRLGMVTGYGVKNA